MSATFDVSVRSAEVLRNLGVLKDTQVKYALMNTINGTAKLIQKQVRAHITRGMTLRDKKEFVLRQAAVIEFASVKQSRYFGKVSVGQKPRLLLEGFEEGAMRTAFKGRRVAIPIKGGPARPFKASPVPEEFVFRKLRLKDARGHRRRMTVSVGTHVTSKGVTQFKGAHRTFLLPQTERAPQGGVFQRVGPGRGDIRMVYSFKPPFRLPRRLAFIETARRVANSSVNLLLASEVSKAVDHAMGRGSGVRTQAERTA